MTMMRRAEMATRRAAIGMTQEQLAERLRVDRSTVVRWESGDTTPQPWQQPRLATLLEITTVQLGRLLDPRTRAYSTAETQPVEPLDRIRRVISAHEYPDDGPIRPIADLRWPVERLVHHRVQANYHELIGQLITVIPELQRAYLTDTGIDGEVSAALLTHAYRCADAVAAKLGYYDLSSHIVELLQHTAHASGDELLIASASYVYTETFFATRNLDAARRMLERAADAVTPSGHTPGSTAAHGALRMRAAVAAARAGDRATTDAHLREAKRAAQHVPDGVYCGTVFGPSSVRIHDLTVCLDLDDPEAALAACSGWRPPVDLPAERLSHYFIDLARAHHRLNQLENSARALVNARAVAPQHVRQHQQVRGLIDALSASRAVRLPEFAELARWTRTSVTG
jgi:transcriptional regulator with XRE-family HTH domain